MYTTSHVLKPLMIVIGAIVFIQALFRRLLNSYFVMTFPGLDCHDMILASTVREGQILQYPVVAFRELCVGLK